MNLLDRFKLWRLRQLKSAQRHVEGTHLGVAKHVVLLYKHHSAERSQDLLEWKREVQAHGTPNLQVIPMAYWWQGKSKKNNENEVTTPFHELPQPWLNFNEHAVSTWRKPKSIELRRFINTEFDLLLYCETEPCWVLEEILARSKAKMKVGPSGLVRSNDLDIILSHPNGQQTFESHMNGMVEFLTQAPLQSSREK